MMAFELLKRMCNINYAYFASNLHLVSYTPQLTKITGIEVLSFQTDFIIEFYVVETITNPQ